MDEFDGAEFIRNIAALPRASPVSIRGLNINTRGGPVTFKK
jgi:hypothetical protein